jgi:hypothetical protein
VSFALLDRKATKASEYFYASDRTAYSDDSREQARVRLSQRLTMPLPTQYDVGEANMARCTVSSLFIQHEEPEASLHWLGSLGKVRAAQLANIVAFDTRSCIQLMQAKDCCGHGGPKMDDRPSSQG